MKRYVLTPYSNYSLTYTKSEASDYCTNQAVLATAVPALLSVSTQMKRYVLTPYSNYSLTYTKSEASDYCTNQAVSATAVPALLSVSTQSEKVGSDTIQ